MKITNLSRSVAIASSTTNGTLVTVTTAVAHNMVTGDTVSFVNFDKRKFTVTVTSSTVFTVPANTVLGYDTETNNSPLPVGECYPTDLRPPGGATTSVGFTNASTSDAVFTFQAVGSTSAGAGASVVNIQCSNDGVNWMTYGTITLTLGTTATSDGLVIAAPWGYFRAQLNSISGTNAKVNVLFGRN
jgi:hypothetical protein